jgi:hypothetical protein
MKVPTEEAPLISGHSDRSTATLSQPLGEEGRAGQTRSPELGHEAPQSSQSPE